MWMTLALIELGVILGLLWWLLNESADKEWHQSQADSNRGMLKMYEDALNGSSQLTRRMHNRIRELEAADDAE